MTVQELLYFIFCIFTAIVGKAIHGSIFYAIVNFCLAPISWLWWIICGSVNKTVIVEALSPFLN